MAKNAMPSQTTHFAGVEAQANTARKRGPNPADLTQGKYMQIPGPARFAGTFSASKGPVQPIDNKGPHKFHIPDKPISTQKGQPSKKT